MLIRISEQRAVNTRYIEDIGVEGREDHCRVRIVMHQSAEFTYRNQYYKSFRAAEQALNELYVEIRLLEGQPCQT